MREINIDYILFIYRESDMLKLGRHEISVPKDLQRKIDGLRKLKGITLKEFMSNVEKTLPVKDLWSRGYCYNSEYDDLSFDSSVKLPKMIVNDYYEKLKELHDEVRRSYRDVTNLSFAEKSKRINDEIQYQKEELDEIYIEKICDNLEELTPYFAYEKARMEILAAYPDVTVFSEDFKGWHDTEFIKLTDDLSVSVSTNFLYGKSSYFRTTFSYKGVKLLTYSNLVRYRYAQMTELLHSTESYIPCRESWESALSDTVEKSNLSLKNIKKFVSRFIKKETEDLITGLNAILDNTSSVMEEYSHFQDNYLIYNTKETDSLDRYYIYPEEEEKLVVIDKVSSALKFISSLQEINDLGFPTTSVIEEVVSMNRRIHHDVESMIGKVKSDIMDLTKQQRNLSNKLKRKNEDFRDDMTEIESATRGMRKDLKNEYVEEYIYMHPEYATYLEEKEEITKDLQENLKHLTGRTNLLDHLTDINDFILELD